MPNDDLLRVNEIRVEKLFGKYTHRVPLRTTDRVTIIHGPNGVGKTVLFRLVAALLAGNLFELAKIPFKSFEVSLSDGSTLGVARTDSVARDEDEDATLAVCYLEKDGQRLHSLKLKSNQVDLRRLSARIEREMPWISRIDDDTFLDRRTDETVTSAQLFAQLAGRSEGSKKRTLFPKADWLIDIGNRVRVHLVETQRLLRLSQNPEEWQFRHQRSSYVATVKNYAKDLQSRISNTLAMYAKQSQSLDQSFPQRLLQSIYAPLSVDELKTRMKELESKRAQLKSIGLIGETSTYPFDVRALERLDSTQGTVMTLYVEDTATKLGVLDSLAQRLEIMIENINSKFAHKSVFIDRDRGFIVRTDDGELLDLDALSSGEQHELVLLYELLFRVTPNTLVLIDEPELSLHVIWQKSFLPDLIKVVAATGYDVILATHSPFIVGERHDLMVQLAEEADNRVSANPL